MTTHTVVAPRSNTRRVWRTQHNTNLQYDVLWERVFDDGDNVLGFCLGQLYWFGRLEERAELCELGYAAQLLCGVNSKRRLW